ncbi:agmatine deiminase family protein [Novosphingobium sp.]|jgi:agmatine deiminase|uniref:agmatine deiminase family protein n=1 Tax=Novosphingobium sp. TaxID=1874826 RepID=UPI0022C4BF2B|nr:agmatine deiminase family protein [Novosphingobium sp.]MCZ8017939.1 agmatine deiminase family protein [Novosphingobium sp.]MCZ8034258.1 agmatine deiminase family protein [Novosphingobium sp.]MCZ8052226.1 agmatine deiminase family protein [Novosphingobium sp.]MCZ8061346.1 agmatine deiminase family protein [Novosphingobium sp.]MCZ8232722.1 agmatine deiminase family protein [Novosphingobium sp.]
MDQPSVWMPPEWHPQDWIWIGFPHDPVEWPGFLERAQEQIAQFANVVAESGQEVRLIVRDEANRARAAALCSAAVKLEVRRYGDVWLRDTGPLVVQRDGQPLGQRFGFNGWGGKYLMEGDQEIGAELAESAGLPVAGADWVLEGGALDCDGTGLVATTEQCLLNPNRNPALSRADLEARLARDLGFTRVLWLGDGLINDHTDGHVDNLARFVAPGVLAVPRATGADDPNAAIYADAKVRAEAFGLKVAEVPSPGRVESEGGRIEPASYMNFAVTSNVVVVPTYGTRHDEDGVAAIQALFPDRAVVGVLADAVLAGGGSFHCASQQMPRF